MDVDLVYTWVNAADIAMQKERARYAALEVDGNFAYRAGGARFQDNGELKFSLRSTERYLPFLRNIYIVHTGDPPNWLKQGNGLTFISQADVIPKRYTPMYQSSAIEAFLYRIPGLSENYIYANDDFFFSAPHAASDLFDEDGKALLARNWRVSGTALGESPLYRKEELRAARAIKQHGMGVPSQSLGRLGWGARLRLFLNGAALLDTTTHVAQPFRKSIWPGFHETFRDEIDLMCQRRFRWERGLALNLLAHHYSIARNKARFVEMPHAFLNRGASVQEATELKETILAGQGCTRFCLNDAAAPDQFDWGEYVRSFLGTYLPAPSRWEVRAQEGN